MLPDAAVGSIIAAAIAGLVVFISTVLTKEQKTSEFRQIWIDELRKDIAQFIAGVSEVVTLHKFKSNDSAEAYKQFLDDNFEVIHELQTIEHRIVLRLNPDEHENLIRQVKTFRKEMIKAHQSTNNDSAELEEKLTKRLLDTTKAVLAFEWKRVKKGEPTFRCVKWGAFGALVCLLGSLVLTLFAFQPRDKTDEKTSQWNSQLVQCFATPEASKTGQQITRKTQKKTKKIEKSAVNECAEKPQSASK